jgi:hypothetical protein
MPTPITGGLAETWQYAEDGETRVLDTTSPPPEGGTGSPTRVDIRPTMNINSQRIDINVQFEIIDRE